MSKILVTAGSKHGATFEIAQSIYDTLQHRGHEVSLARPGDVGALAGFDAIVLGSSVYAGHWHKEAKDLARRIGEAAPRPAVWLFSSGPLGDSPKPEDDPADMVSILESTGARDHRVFAGKIDKAKLSFAERAIMTALHAPEGDFREWDQVTDWAEDIGAALETKAAPSH